MNLGVMFLFSKILCKSKGHKWRRAHKSEPQDRKYCVRCHLGVSVNKRKAKETT
jgi:hypothetical protein